MSFLKRLLLLTGLLAVVSPAAVILSNGAVTFDGSTQLIRFQFTLTSNLPGERIETLVFDADPGASWNDATAGVVSASHPWTAVGVEGGEFFAGNLNTPIIFDGVTGLNFDYIFQGAENAIGSPWQISAGANASLSERISVLNNVDLATGVAGNVNSEVPEPSSALLLCAGMSFVAFRLRRQ